MGIKAMAFVGVVVMALPRVAMTQDTAGPVARRPIPPARDSIPVGSRPPAGMCRVWLENVPVAQQPAPTDCTTAVRNRPAKGRVIFGDDYVTKPESARTLPFAKGFSPAKVQPLTKKPVPPAPRDTL